MSDYPGRRLQRKVRKTGARSFLSVCSEALIESRTSGGGGGGGVCVGGGVSFSLHLRVVHTLSVCEPMTQRNGLNPNHDGSNTERVARARPVFAGDVPRMFSLIKNEGDPRHLGTVVVFTANHADWRLRVACFVTLSAPHVKSKFFGFWEGTTRSGACGLIWFNTWKLTKSRQSKKWQIDCSFLVLSWHFISTMWLFFLGWFSIASPKLLFATKDYITYLLSFLN